SGVGGGLDLVSDPTRLFVGSGFDSGGCMVALVVVVGLARMVVVATGLVKPLTGCVLFLGV
ncbi:hypothetical protein A2U01_0085747, partial [Trifolium medium]|nr:hypothetical protein [Trifolium medium]